MRKGQREVTRKISRVDQIDTAIRHPPRRESIRWAGRMLR